MQGKALQAKERLQEGWREGNNNTIWRCDDDDDWSAKNRHSTPQEAIKTLLLKERLLEGCRKGGWVLVGGLAMVNGVKESRA